MSDTPMSHTYTHHTHVSYTHTSHTCTGLSWPKTQSEAPAAAGGEGRVNVPRLPGTQVPGGASFKAPEVAFTKPQSPASGKFQRGPKWNKPILRSRAKVDKMQRLTSPPATAPAPTTAPPASVSLAPQPVQQAVPAASLAVISSPPPIAAAPSRTPDVVEIVGSAAAAASAASAAAAAAVAASPVSPASAFASIQLNVGAGGGASQSVKQVGQGGLGSLPPPNQGGWDQKSV